MSKATGFHPSLAVDTAGAGVVSHAGALLLVDTASIVGLERALSAQARSWRAHPGGLDQGRPGHLALVSGQRVHRRRELPATLCQLLHRP